ncbi:MAG TPA: WecB/TagA/CpsF family glycosyltransferase [Planctomycetota bacterium]|nr:WecB/TagA/CpsF family glycosyltransferase [Planctomycetota bacterium]
MLFGVPFHNVTFDEALAGIAARARSGRPSQIVTSNLDFIFQAWKDPEMHRIHLEADLVFADGWPPVTFSRFFGPPLKERVAGSDLVPHLASVARDHGLSIYALGGKPGVAQEAMRILAERCPGLRVAGCESPPLQPLLEMDHLALCRRIEEAKPDILLVAFGAPKQDKWIRMNRSRIGAPVALGVGGSLDFIAGTQNRAPRWIQRIHMEWFWRLASQPTRLFRRYSSNLVFLMMMLGRLMWVRLSPPGRGAGSPVPDGPEWDSGRVARMTLARLPDAQTAAEFCARHEARAREAVPVLDLLGCTWLNSLELGAVARLARAAGQGGRPLLLAGVSSRVRRLLRLFRLDRFVEIATSPEAWARRLEDLGRPSAGRAAEWTTESDLVRILLPEQFEGDGAWGLEREFLDRTARGEFRRVVVDGRRLRYIDSSGVHFLKTVQGDLGGKPGAAMTLRSFPRPVLEILRREGLGSIPVDAAGSE